MSSAYYLDVDPLRGPRLKFGRAEEHLNTLAESIHTFDKEQPKRTGSKYNAELQAWEFLTLDEWIAPIRWSVIIGDVLSNARMSLDHLYWLIEGRPTPQERRINFPTHDTGMAIPFIKATANMRALIEAVQPRARDGMNDPLFLLREMNNADKHRLLMIAIHHVAGGVFGVPPGVDFRRFQWVHGPLKPNAVFLRVRADLKDKMDVSPQPIGIPVFDQGPADGREVLMILGDILSDIRQNILGKVTETDLP